MHFTTKKTRHFRKLQDSKQTNIQYLRKSSVLDPDKGEKDIPNSFSESTV